MSPRTALFEVKPTLPSWKTAAGWLAAFIAFPAAGLTAQLFVGALENPVEGVVAGAAAGLVIGLGQWLALRRAAGIKAHWIAASALGMAVGLGLAVAFFGVGTGPVDLANRALVTGGTLGLTQGLAMSRRFKTIALWAVTVTGAFTLAWVITGSVIVEHLSNGYAIFGSSGAITFQFITGLALLLALEIPGQKSGLTTDK